MELGKFKNVVEWLSLSSRCPICSQRYNINNTKVVKDNDNSFLIHIDCIECHGSIMANISVQGTEVFSVGMITDLTSSDAIRFTDRSYVGYDDAISMHQYLQDFNGDFIGLFGRTAPAADESLI